VLINAGYFQFWPLYFVLMFGDILGDVIWYAVGRYFGHSFITRFGRYFHMTEEKVAKATAVFHKHKNPILIISKITNGFGFALVTLISAGIVRIPFRHYLALNAIGQILWTGVLLGVGYFFGRFFMTIEYFMGKGSALGLVVLAGILVFFLYKYVRATILRRARLDNQ
jgi:membrane protein DedA with SNARE-associated domain